MARMYGNKELTGDSACPKCREMGRDKSGNHLQHWKNHENGQEYCHCPKCGHYELVTDENREGLARIKSIRIEKTPEEIAEALADALELPIKELKSRAISHAVAERFEVRVGLSYEDGETPVSHFYPKTVDGVITGYKVRNLSHKGFWTVGKATGCDLFGINQARLGDVYSKILYLFEDELSAMSGYQVLTTLGKSSTIKPACVSLPDGASAAAGAITRNIKFIERFEEVIVCMDNDDAGEDAVNKIRAMLPHIQVARIPKGLTKAGKEIKDANDLLMEGRGLELYNALRYNKSKESPAGAATVSDCLEDALKKPEYGLDYPWPGLTELTFGLRYGDMIAVGGGVGGGKTLLAHELSAYLINTHKEKVGVFMLEETPGNTLKNVAGKSANIPFHRPDAEFDPDLLRNEILKYDGMLHLYKNFGQNDWQDIKRCMRFWVVEHGIKFIFLDNITALTAHLSATEINTEVATIAAELSGMCNELNFTCFVFSHLNPPKGGAPHENGGQVQEVQFTGSRGLMRFSQLILGFERDKQAEGDDKNLSQIRVLKDRYFGQTGVIGTKYNPLTGRLTQRSDEEFDPKNPFSSGGGEEEAAGNIVRDTAVPF
ncbi:primase/helicase [Trabzonvirus APT65]|uniref:Primase/helicase n=1 Tax=Aeromonas phage APT65 TaxID=2982914 RepID=A0A9E8GA90_9CAUD|nr:primase/helicase [Aeromonas phage APT65]